MADGIRGNARFPHEQFSRKQSCHAHIQHFLIKIGLIREVGGAKHSPLLRIPPATTLRGSIGVCNFFVFTFHVYFFKHIFNIHLQSNRDELDTLKYTCLFSICRNIFTVSTPSLRDTMKLVNFGVIVSIDYCAK